MNTLLLDIETAPNTAFVWGLFDQNVSHDQVKESSYILCWAAKWHRDSEMQFDSIHVSSTRAMLQRIHKLLAKADVVVHFNGMKFDIPVLNKEFIKHGLMPPAPYKQVDLYRVVRHSFRFESNKMDAITNALGLGRKTKHRGFELWTRCMENDAAAWKVMERYNKRDVWLLERLYYRLRPWIVNHPHLIDGNKLKCPRCCSTETHRRGTAVAVHRKYNRYQCQQCAGWFRGNKVMKLEKGEKGVNI